ncbi:MAG: hypothetical protein LBR39_02170 [Coriobacteriales bacterium]|jgi:antitoxin component of RelBE/YafQ-DinJ toxin-antitoxin module|nr:hypothetical protein [Coriobacteriales bacterium]
MDAMVTGRMSQSKKEAGNAILTQLGTNASAVINRLYDFIIEQGRLPFAEPTALDAAEIQRRIAVVDSIPLMTGNRFATMTDDEIRRERLGVV